jgi:hypothetical protein
MASEFDEQRAKKERSPSFPFIPLPKALERLQSFYEAHRKEPTRIGVVASTWHYSPTSSGLAQTIAALKQFGLLEEVKGADDRKVQITDLGRKIISDQRPGAKEQGITEAAQRPRLIAEYLPVWVPDRPNDTHRVSDLEFDRGFNQAAARLFLRVFDETVDFAGLSSNDRVGDSEIPSDAVDESDDGGGRDVGGSRAGGTPALPPMGSRDRPLSERLQVTTTGNQLTVSAALINGREVDKLIRILEANKMLLDDEEEEAQPPAGD